MLRPYGAGIFGADGAGMWRTYAARIGRTYGARIGRTCGAAMLCPYGARIGRTDGTGTTCRCGAEHRRTGRRPRPAAFTLVELLVTMVVIGILAAVTLGALQRAHQAADIAKTRSLVAQLHSQLMVRWESYRTRRVPVSTAGAAPQAAAAVRLAAMRELMRFELPERYTDILDDPRVLPALPKPANAPASLNHGGVSAISNAFLQRYLNNTNPRTGSKALPDPRYEGAECLYMILTMSNDDDFSGAEQFKPKDIGDADGDGMPEFHDAWGQPIEFLRWAPGFVSDIQPSTDPNGLPAPADPNRQPSVRHDPMDPLKLQKDAFTLYPLIYSGGLDRQTDIYRGDPATPYRYANDNPFVLGGSKIYNNPYGSLTTSPPYYGIGAPGDVDSDGDEGWADNIHNHLIGLR